MLLQILSVGHSFASTGDTLSSSFRESQILTMACGNHISEVGTARLARSQNWCALCNLDPGMMVVWP